MSSRLPTHDAIVRFIALHIRTFDWPPTRREIAAEFQISLSTAQILTMECREMGLIEVGYGARQLRLTQKGNKLLMMKAIVDPETQF
jgi:Mn-dependent DtxR family transcriptional regulator